MTNLKKTTYEGFTIWYEELYLFGTEAIIEDEAGKPVKHILHGKNEADVIEKAEIYIDEYLSNLYFHIPGVEGYPFRYNRSDWSPNDYGEMILSQHGEKACWSRERLWHTDGYRLIRPVEYIQLTEADRENNEPAIWTIL